MSAADARRPGRRRPAGPGRPGRTQGLALLVGVGIALAALAGPWGAARPRAAHAAPVEMRGELALAASLASDHVHGVFLGGRMELSGLHEPGQGSQVGGAPTGEVGVPASRATAEWRIAVDPALQVDVRGPGATGGAGWRTSARPMEWAVEEAYVALRRDGLALSAGRERLPLEVARLAVPYSIEPLSAGGARLGVWGARVTLFSGGRRLRLVAAAEGGRIRPGASLRWQAGGWDLEAHGVAGSPEAPPAAGLTAAGLLGERVVYGEVWHAREWRYLVGLSGLRGDVLWTVEAGRAIPAPGQGVLDLLAAQAAWQADPGTGWSVTAVAFPDGAAVPVQLAVDRTAVSGPHEIALRLGATFAPSSSRWFAVASYRYYWDVAAWDVAAP